MTETQMPMFYRDVVAISTERHKDWYVDADQGYAFASKTHAIFIAATEIPVAAREFPIVFAPNGTGSDVVPMAVLGLRQNENLMVNSDGSWAGSYVPAYVRRYPFILASASADSDTFTVCIDEAYSGFNTAREGDRLINEDGEHGEQLATAVKFLRDFHDHSRLTSVFCAALVEAGLLETMQANIELSTGTKFSLTGLQSVTKDKLAKLSGKKLKHFLDEGYLDLIYHHMHSLTNFERLMNLVGTEDKESDQATSGAHA